MGLKIKWQDNQITDWIQAIGAIVAIIAAIFGFASLFRRDFDKQNQIDNLRKLAEQSEEQTKLLRTQTSLLAKNVINRKVDIKPNLTIPRDHFFGGGYVYNSGGMAFIDTVIINPKSTVKYRFNIKTLGTKENVPFDAWSTLPAYNIADFTVYYHDGDGNKYKQNFYADTAGVKITQPKELK